MHRFKENYVEITIMNVKDGRIVKSRRVKTDEAESTFIKKAAELSQWFDKKDTFFDKSIWNHWKSLGITEKFKSVFLGFSSVAAESVVTFDDNSNCTEYEFSVYRV